jgi:hypothetical protein
MGQHMEVVTMLKNWCGLLGVHDVIDGTHVSISKQNIPFVKDYYYHKTWGYLIVAQAIVGVKRCFIDVYAGLLRSVNDF